MSKPAWLYQQSAVIPYLVEKGVLKVVLITSNSSRRWIVPKGVIEAGMSPGESAAKEALEEAGILGEVAEEMVAEYEYKKWGGTCHVQVYPMEVTTVLDSWEEMDHRERIVVEAEEAVALVKPVLRDVMDKFLMQYVDGKI